MTDNEHIMSMADGKLDISVWASRSWSGWESNYDKYVDAMKKCGVSAVRLMIDSQKDYVYGFSNFDDDHRNFISLCHSLQKDGFDTILSLWPEPIKQEIKDLIWGDKKHPPIFEVLAESKCKKLELDAEGGNWKDWVIKGFGDDKSLDSLNEITDYLFAEFKRYREQDPVVDKYIRDTVKSYKKGNDIFACTTHHGRLTRSYNILLHCSQISFQAYSKNDPDDKNRDWDGRYRPGEFQKSAVRKAVKLNTPDQRDFKYLVGGTAAWSQKFPGHKEEEAMRLALLGLVESDVKEASYWALKWLVRNEYARDFLGMYRDAENKLEFLRTPLERNGKVRL